MGERDIHKLEELTHYLRHVKFELYNLWFCQPIEYVDLTLQKKVKSGGKPLRNILKEIIVKAMGVNRVSQKFWEIPSRASMEESQG